MSPDEPHVTPANVPAPTPQLAQPISGATPAQQEAAAQLVRTQIDSLYDASAQTSTPLADSNPYERTHAANPQPDPDQWKQYHSAWQTYYQKYYEGYYTHHLSRAQQALDTKQQAPSVEQQGYFTHQPNEPEQQPDAALSKEEALFDLRQRLLTQVSDSAKKVRKSRHFVPITAAILVVLIFIFLQYNRVFISNVMAYVTPGSIDPQNIVIDPSTDVTVGPESRLVIPKINVDVPVHYDVGNDYASQMKAMETGVAHFAIAGASSHPGQIGNTVIAGHSSNDILDTGDYKFIFAQLDKLSIGDSMYANYNGKRYTYTITKKEVVEPSEVSKLVYATDKPVMTLITCTPLGTALHRLLITGEQVSPDPAASTAAPAVTDTGEAAAIPGNSPTLFERLFGG